MLIIHITYTRYYKNVFDSVENYLTIFTLLFSDPSKKMPLKNIIILSQVRLELTISNEKIWAIPKTQWDNKPIMSFTNKKRTENNFDNSAENAPQTRHSLIENQ